MATLEEQRRASGRAMEQERRTRSQRRTGREMEAERRGTEVVDDINRLTRPPTAGRVSLRPIEPVGALPARRGRGVYTPPASTGTGGGIASPLTETNFAARTYWPNGQYSADGLLTIPAIRTMNLTDADGNPVVINMAQPA